MTRNVLYETSKDLNVQIVLIDDLLGVKSQCCHRAPYREMTEGIMRCTDCSREMGGVYADKKNSALILDGRVNEEEIELWVKAWCGTLTNPDFRVTVTYE